MPTVAITAQRPRVVIVGAGFGGLSAARALAKAPVDVTVIDRRNYHLFQPLLYQVATAGLSPADIAWPIRSILKAQINARVLLGRVTGVDPAEQAVALGDRRVPYDFLVIATGVRHAYFGHPEWEAAAPGLKKIVDATRIRERLLFSFEQAEMQADPVEQRRLLNFVVVGAGPTGVEMAGAIAELAKKALITDFRVVDPCDTRIILVEAGPRILPAFPERLSAVAQRALEKLGVEVLLDQPVTRCDAGGVVAAGQRIEARTVLWAAGVMASPAAKWLGAETDGVGRVEVAADFSVPGLPNVFVLGDTAAAIDDTGQLLPGIAPAAKQAGRYVGNLIAKRVIGEPDGRPFRYRHFGDLATIGRKSAVVRMGRIEMSGFSAWLLWSIAHIYFLIGLRNRAIVALNWLWSYLTFERGARLITSGEEDAPIEAADSVDFYRKGVL